MSRRDSSRLEQSSISFEQCEEEEKRHYDTEEERLWKRQDMSAFKEAWQEAMYGEEEFVNTAREERKRNEGYSTEDYRAWRCMNQEQQQQQEWD